MVDSYAGKILRINLSKERGISKEALNMDFAKKFLGGKGFGAKLLYDILRPNADPFGPDNSVIYCTGPITATMAPCNRYCIVTKSPLTGAFSDSYAGGYFGQELKYAGYDVVIISGKAKKPVYIWIDDEDIDIKPADHLWGMDTYEVYKVLKKEAGDETAKISCIGPAGERKVRFALIDCEYHRQAGRCGTGAVMGSKNIKAIVARGTKDISVAHPKAFEEAIQTAYDEVAECEESASRWIKTGGTPAFIPFANEQALYPIRNFQDGYSEKAENLNDVEQRKSFWLREYGCFACPVHCTKIGMIRKGPFAGTVCDVIEYETTGLLGANCEIYNVEALAYANCLCDRLGLDTISTGNVVGFAMECYERGILTRKDTGGIELTFGNWEAQIELIKKIAHREGIGDTLAEGIMRAAKVIGKGAEDLAVHVKGMEAPAWGPRGAPGEGLALATADRGADHQKAWPIAFEVQGSIWPGGHPVDRLTTEGKAEAVKWEQEHLAALYCLVICEIFSHTGIKNNTYAKLASAATGWDIDYVKLLEYGERTWNVIKLYNWREGFRRKDDDLPPRFKEPLPSGPAKGHKFTDEDLNKMLDEYYTLRGWDKEGKPSRNKLLELELEDLAEL